MRIIRMGEIPQQIRVTCDACETEFLCEQRDVQVERKKRIENHMTMGGVWDDYIKELVFYVECPLCKKHFIIANKTESINKLTFDEMFMGEREAFEEKIGWNN